MDSSTQTKKVKDSDAASVTSTSSFKSTMPLLKSKAQSDDKPSEKNMSFADKVNGEDKTRTLSSDEKRTVLRKFILGEKWKLTICPARQRTAEAYAIFGAFK